MTQPGETAAAPDPPRMAREKRTIAEMMRIFCLGRHQAGEPLCAECRQLLDYALCRLDRCPFGAEKPACSHCPIHCYKPEMRERVREVMRYAGPKMLLRRPLLALRHKLDVALGDRDAS